MGTHSHFARLKTQFSALLKSEVRPFYEGFFRKRQNIQIRLSLRIHIYGSTMEAICQVSGLDQYLCQETSTTYPKPDGGDALTCHTFKTNIARITCTFQGVYYRNELCILISILYFFHFCDYEESYSHKKNINRLLDY